MNIDQGNEFECRGKALSLWTTPIAQLEAPFNPMENERISAVAKSFYLGNVEQSKAFEYRTTAQNIFTSHKESALLKLVQIQHLAAKEYLQKFFPEVSLAQISFQMDGFANHQSKQGKWTAPHVHDACHFVMDYCAFANVASSESGNLNLHDPRHTTVSWMDRTAKKVFSIPRRAGDLIIFPAYLAHSLSPLMQAGDEVVSVITNMSWSRKSESKIQSPPTFDKILHFQQEGQ